MSASSLAPINSKIPSYEKGQRVVFRVKFNNPGENMRPEDKINGTILHVFHGETQPPTYRIELDQVWSNRVAPHFRGKKIIVGNVREEYISPASP